MKRIVFIHGLESSNKSSKVDWMKSKGFDVLAPRLFKIFEYNLSEL